MSHEKVTGNNSIIEQILKKSSKNYAELTRQIKKVFHFVLFVCPRLQFLAFSLEGLGELGDPLPLNCGSHYQVHPSCSTPLCAAPKLPTIKDALDKFIHTGQLVRVNVPTPWISNMVVRERPATTTKPA